MPLSAALYVYSVATAFNLPPGRWRATGSSAPSAGSSSSSSVFCSRPQRLCELFAARENDLFGLSGLQTLIGATIALATSRPIRPLPDPKLFFVFDKTYHSPARVDPLPGAGLFFRGAFSRIVRWTPPLARRISRCWAQFAQVFCAGSLLSLCGQIARYILAGVWKSTGSC